MPEPLPDRQPLVAAVVTAFAPGLGLTALVDSVLPQVATVVIIEDGSPTTQATDEALAAAERAGARVHRHPDNRGIAAALNTGIARARDLVPGLVWVLTLDQDSLLPSGYVATLIAAASRAQSQGIPVGMVGPGAASSVGGKVVNRWVADGSVALGNEPIQSGLLIPVSTLDAVGDFDEDLFIDGVDSDFYLRATRAGLQCVVATEVSLDHRLGRAHPVRLGSRTIELVVASDFRYYYQARNTAELVRRHARTHPRWSVTAGGKFLRHVAITSLLVPGRRRRWRAIGAGLADARRGRLGRQPD